MEMYYYFKQAFASMFSNHHHHHQYDDDDDNYEDFLKNGWALEDLKITKRPVVNRRMPYLSSDLHRFNYKTQLPIDDEKVVCDSDSFDYDAITVQSLYRNKKKIVAYLKMKYLNSDKRNDVVEEVKSIREMRDRLLAGRKPFRAPVTIENKIVVNAHNFTKSLLKLEFFKYKKNIRHSYLYADVDAFVGTIIEFLCEPSALFNFNKIYTERYNENIGKGIEEREEKKLQEMNAKRLKDFPMARMITFRDCYDEIQDAKEKVVEFNLEYFNKHVGRLPDDEDCDLMETFEFPLILFNVAEIENKRYPVSFSGRYSLVENSLDSFDDDKCMVLVMSPKFDEYNDHLIYKTLFRGRQVPVKMGLIYYIIYRIAKTSIGGFFKEYRDELREYALRRILMTKCSLSLSTLNFYPRLQVPLMNAVYYSFYVSGKIFKKQYLYFYQERLRELYPYAECFYNILMMYGGDKGIVHEVVRGSEARTLYRARFFQRQARQAIVDDVLRLIKSSFRKTDRGYVTWSRHDDDNDSKLLRNKPIHDIHKIFNFLGDLNKYVHSYYSYQYMGGVGKEVIDKRTMRPRFVTMKTDERLYTFYDTVRKTQSLYLTENGVFKCECGDRIAFDFDRMLSLYKLFQGYTIKHKKFPSLEDYHVYVYNKSNNRKDGKICFFDPNVAEYVDNVYRHYMYFIETNKVSVESFIDALKKSENLYDRIRIEDNGIKDENEIKKIVDNLKNNVLYLSQSL
ncbi:P94 [Spodoptera eridania nucleopolyhedrovirus]|uniref:P94 n=1 Tax=Spodoptera eridania nucleopolyhedrovirus TaxID=2315721 RepID=A0A346TQ36_9ABAC|nr:P94 [Spodoptera eridania nucleopolyhedrovirus]AXU41696.1 P94 [Spodoptera eridania nucleopolyhedrovirus]